MAADGSRPELTVREGERVPGDLPQGDVILTRLKDGRLRVDRADPRVLVSAEVLDVIMDGDHVPAVRLDVTGCENYDGALLKIEAVNQSLVYRITGYVPEVRGYIAEWPD